jgi:hypothetical protein
MFSPSIPVLPVVSNIGLIKSGLYWTSWKNNLELAGVGKVELLSTIMTPTLTKHKWPVLSKSHHQRRMCWQSLGFLFHVDNMPKHFNTKCFVASNLNSCGLREIPANTKFPPTKGARNVEILLIFFG